MKKAVIALTLILALSTVSSSQLFDKAQAQTINITIKTDGSITPPTAPIQQNGSAYFLTSDITGIVSVQRSNMVFDGNRHTLLTGEISLDGVTNATLKNFHIANTTEIGPFAGISLVNSSNCTIANNTITGIWNIMGMNAVEYVGIYVKGGSSNSFTGNTLVNNMAGMIFRDSSHNLINGNDVTCGANSWNLYSNVGGILFANSSNNTIYHNNFRIYFSNHAGDTFNSINVWDDGFPGGGNYWSDYLTKYPRAQMIGNSGIGNFSYVIDSQNMDRFPLLEEFAQFQVLAMTPPKISVASPLNQTYNESTVSLLFTSDKLASWTGYSLDGEQNVTLTGNATLANLTNGLHNIVVFANDTFGNIGASETVTFTVAVPEPFPTTLVIAASVASLAVIAASLLVYFKKRKRGVAQE